MKATRQTHPDQGSRRKKNEGGAIGGDDYEEMGGLDSLNLRAGCGWCPWEVAESLLAWRPSLGVDREVVGGSPSSRLDDMDGIQHSERSDRQIGRAHV